MCQEQINHIINSSYQRIAEELAIRKITETEYCTSNSCEKKEDNDIIQNN